MVKLTQDMKDIAAKAKVFIMATAGKDGKPNGVPVGIARVTSDEEITIADNFMMKTRRNIEENPKVAVSLWSADDHYGYQFKGKARIETSGKNMPKNLKDIRRSTDWSQNYINKLKQE